VAERKRDMKKQSEWSRAYTAKAYDRLYPFVPKGYKAEIQEAAEMLGETLNEFIVKAIDERMKQIGITQEPSSPPSGDLNKPAPCLDLKELRKLDQRIIDEHNRMMWNGEYPTNENGLQVIPAISDTDRPDDVDAEDWREYMRWKFGESE
jgi:hypothetical protein